MTNESLDFDWTHDLQYLKCMNCKWDGCEECGHSWNRFYEQHDPLLNQALKYNESFWMRPFKNNLMSGLSDRNN